MPLFLMPVGGHGQELLPGLSPAEPAAETETVEPEPEPEPVVYSLAEASERITNHRQNLRAVEQFVEDDSVIERIQGQVTTVASDLRVMRLEVIRINRLNALQLASLRRRAEFNTESLNALEIRAATRVAALEEMRNLILGHLENWTRTEEQLGEDLPDAMAEALQAYRASAEPVLADVRDAIEEMLTVQKRMQSLEMGLQAVIEATSRSTARQMKGMFNPDVAPIWKGLAEGTPMWGTLGVSGQLSDAVSQLSSFARTFRVNLALHGVATLLLVGLLIHFRRRLRNAEDAPRLAKGVATVLERPVSSSLLVMVFAIEWFYPYTPAAVTYLAVALLCIPLLRLLWQILPRSTRLPIAVFIVLGLIVSTAVGLLGQTSLSQLVQSILALPLSFAVAWGGLRAAAYARIHRPRMVHLLLTVTWLVAATFVACSAAAALGYLKLAAFLYDMAFSASLAALFYFALARVLGGSLVMLLRSRLAGLIRSVRKSRSTLQHDGLKLIRTGAVIAWLATVLSAAGLLPATIDAARAALSASFDAGTLNISLGRLVAFALTLWVAFFVARVVTAVLDNDMLPRMALDRGVPDAISKLSRYLIVSLGVLFALAAAGFELQNLALLATAFSIGIGFGLQTLVNNFVSGLILMFERPVQAGDVVEVSGRLGTVHRIGIRSSTVRQYDGAELVVPNGNLIAEDIVNWTLSDNDRRIEIAVGVAYGSDLRKTTSVLLACAQAEDGVSREPAPMAVFTEFGDSSINFALRCWTSHWDRVLTIRSSLALRVNDELAAAGIEIPFPQRDLHLRTSLIGRLDDISRSSGGGAGEAGEGEGSTGS